jgi:hypothetical protein
MFDFYSKNIIYNYVKLASLLLASLDVPVVSCAAVNPAVGDVLTAVDVPASVPDVAAPILLMTSNLLFLFLSFLTSLLLLTSQQWLASLLLLLLLMFLLLSAILFLLSGLLR